MREYCTVLVGSFVRAGLPFRVALVPRYSGMGAPLELLMRPVEHGR